MPTHYPIRAVAKITGISPETLRAWERRYQAVVPERTGRGRQYGPEQIERLGRLNRLVRKGHAIGSIAGLPDDQLDALDAVPAHPAAVAATAPTPSADMLAPVLAAIDLFDATRAGDELSRLAAVLAPRELVHRVVMPLMGEVGVRWHDGRLTVAQEHLVSQLLRNLLGSMSRLFRPSSPSARMVVATPAGERHEFGILAASMLAAMSGIEPVYLGADLPADEIGHAATRVSAPIVLLGISVASAHALEQVRSIAQAMPSTSRLWLGGADVAALDLSLVARPTVVFSDLSAFEDACQRWR